MCGYNRTYSDKHIVTSKHANEDDDNSRKHSYSATLALFLYVECYHGKNVAQPGLSLFSQGLICFEIYHFFVVLNKFSHQLQTFGAVVAQLS